MGRHSKKRSRRSKHKSKHVSAQERTQSANEQPVDEVVQSAGSALASSPVRIPHIAQPKSIFPIQTTQQPIYSAKKTTDQQQQQPPPAKSSSSSSDSSGSSSSSTSDGDDDDDAASKTSSQVRRKARKSRKRSRRHSVRSMLTRSSQLSLTDRSRMTSLASAKTPGGEVRIPVDECGLYATPRTPKRLLCERCRASHCQGCAIVASLRRSIGLPSTPKSTVGGKQQQQQACNSMATTASTNATRAVIMVDPRNDESMYCNCSNCQFLSGWCCLPTLLFVMLLLFLLWLLVLRHQQPPNYYGSDEAGPSDLSTKPMSLVASTERGGEFGF